MALLQQHLGCGHTSSMRSDPAAHTPNHGAATALRSHSSRLPQLQRERSARHPDLHAATHLLGRACVGRQRARPSWVARAVVDDQEDLLQHPERIKWYESKFCADDMPDWNMGRFLRSEDVAPGVRHVVLECEIGRERVPLRNAYKAVGQRASVRVNSGVEYNLTVSSPPFSTTLNREALFRTRGDLFAYEVKTAKEPISTLVEVHLLVTREEAPEVYDLEEDDSVEVGPFRGSGLDLRGSGILAVYQYQTLVMFVSGQGVASALALLQCSSDVPNLSPRLRTDVRIYFKVPNAASAAYAQQLRDLDQAVAPCGYGVVVTTSSFSEAFDDDDTLTYEPNSTAALILTGGDAEAEAAALEACREAEISTTLCDSREQAAPVYLASVPPSFARWKKDKDGDVEAAVPAGEGAAATNGKAETKSNVVPLNKPKTGRR